MFILFLFNKSNQMKYLVLIVLLFFCSLDLNSQDERNIKNGERYDDEELKSALSRDVSLVITRDDALTLFIKELELAIPNDSRYLVDILIECYGEEGQVTPVKKYSYAFNRTEPIPEGGTKLTVDYTPIFKDIDIKEVHHLSVAVTLTKVEEDEVKRLEKILNKYVDQAFKVLPIGDVLSDIIGFDDDTKTKRKEFCFKANYAIPMNFLEYHIHIEKDVPVLSNGVSQIITMQTERPIENNSLTSKVKDFLRSGGKILTGKQYVMDVDFEKIKGYCELSFSKDFNANIPAYMERSLVKLVESIEYRNTDSIKENIADSENKLEEFLEDSHNNQRGYNNVKLLIELTKTMELMYEAEGIDGNDSEVISKFKSWLKSASAKSATNNFTQIFYKNTYTPEYDSIGKVAKEYDGVIYIPYSLGNEFIEQVITFQQTLHEFTANYFKDNPSELNDIKYFTKEFPTRNRT